MGSKPSFSLRPGFLFHVRFLSFSFSFCFSLLFPFPCPCLSFPFPLSYLSRSLSLPFPFAATGRTSGATYAQPLKRAQPNTPWGTPPHRNGAQSRLSYTDPTHHQMLCLPANRDTTNTSPASTTRAPHPVMRRYYACPRSATTFTSPDINFRCLFPFLPFALLFLVLSLPYPSLPVALQILGRALFCNPEVRSETSCDKQNVKVAIGNSHLAFHLGLRVLRMQAPTSSLLHLRQSNRVDVGRCSGIKVSSKTYWSFVKYYLSCLLRLPFFN